jgi:hypothetical protein
LQIADLEEQVAIFDFGFWISLSLQFIKVFGAVLIPNPKPKIKNSNLLLNLQSPI